MESLTVDQMLILAEALAATRNADAEVRALLDRYEVGRITFAAVLEQLKALSTVH